MGAVAEKATVSVDAAYVTDFGATDEVGTALTVKELAAFSPEVSSGARRRALDNADAWEFGDEFTYPLLKAINIDAAVANAAALVLTGANDTYNNVTDVMNIGLPKGAVWSFSNPAVLGINSENPAQVDILSASTDEVQVTVTVGSASKTWNVKLNTTQPVTTAIETINGNAKGVKSVRYFNINGVESAEPVEGVNIIVKTKADGTIQVQKAVK